MSQRRVPVRERELAGIVPTLGGVTLQKAQGGSKKKKGATGITTVAPSVAGQWGRGDNRLPG